MLQLQTGLPLEAIQRAAAHYRVILLSPEDHNRNRLKAELLELPGVHWHSLAPQDETLLSLVKSFAETLCIEDQDFGQQTLPLLQLREVSPETLADALLADIRQLKKAMQYLVLDSFDCLNASDEVAAFFDRLVAKIGNTPRLVIDGRAVSDVLWSPMIRSGHAVVLGEAGPGRDGSFECVAEGTPYLEVFGFGIGRASINGLPIKSWEGSLVRDLFFFFIEHPMVTRAEIFQAFWPNVAQKEAINALHVAKRTLCDILGFDLMEYSDGFYHLSQNVAFSYDVAQFTSAIEEARFSDLPDDWNRAIRLHRNNFLGDTDRRWINERREELHNYNAEALVAVGQEHKRRGQLATALSFFLRALVEVPEREDVHREVIALHHQMGQKDKAIRHYRLLENILWETLDVAPDPTTCALYQSIAGKPVQSQMVSIPR